MSHLAIGGGKKAPLNIQERKHPRVRGNLLIYCALPLLLLAAVLVGCTDNDNKPETLEPLMTRADSIAAGLIVVVPTADGEWTDTITVNWDNPAPDDIPVGGQDTDLENPWGE